MPGPCAPEPLCVLLARITTQTTNPYGKHPDEQVLILRYLAEVELRLRATATIDIDACAPISQVIEQVKALAERTATLAELRTRCGPVIVRDYGSCRHRDRPPTASGAVSPSVNDALTVGRRSNGLGYLATLAAFGRTMALNVAACCALVSIISAGQQVSRGVGR
jgi:hypothetical protein